MPGAPASPASSCPPSVTRVPGFLPPSDWESLGTKPPFSANSANGRWTVSTDFNRVRAPFVPAVARAPQRARRSPRRRRGQHPNTSQEASQPPPALPAPSEDARRPTSRRLPKPLPSGHRLLSRLCFHGNAPHLTPAGRKQAPTCKMSPRQEAVARGSRGRGASGPPSCGVLQAPLVPLPGPQETFWLRPVSGALFPRKGQHVRYIRKLCAFLLVLCLRQLRFEALLNTLGRKGGGPPIPGPRSRTERTRFRCLKPLRRGHRGRGTSVHLCGASDHGAPRL